MNIETLLAILLGLSTGVLGWMQWKSNSQVQKADATNKIGDTYSELLDQLRKQIGDIQAESEKHNKEMDNRLTYLESELKRYANWSARLVRQLVDHGIEPVKIDTGPLNPNAQQNPQPLRS